MRINIEYEGKRGSTIKIQQNLISSWPIRGVLLDTGNISATIVAKIVTVSIMATPEKVISQ